MTFGREYSMSDFESVLTEDFQKTSQIAKKVGCCQKTATTELNLLLQVKELQGEEMGIPNDIEVKWVSGGRDGTRAWRKVSKQEMVLKGRQYGRVKSIFDNYMKTCKYRAPLNIQEDINSCSSNESISGECNEMLCPMIIRR